MCVAGSAKVWSTSRSADVEVTRDGSPVEVYRRLPATGEAELIHRAIPAGATVLDLGCGTGRIARGLVALGHPVTGVDDSPAMIAELPPDVTGVVAEIGALSLADRFDVALLASHLVNDSPLDRRPRSRPHAGTSWPTVCLLARPMPRSSTGRPPSAARRGWVRSRSPSSGPRSTTRGSTPWSCMPSAIGHGASRSWPGCSTRWPCRDRSTRPASGSIGGSIDQDGSWPEPAHLIVDPLPPRYASGRERARHRRPPATHRDPEPCRPVAAGSGLGRGRGSTGPNTGSRASATLRPLQRARNTTLSAPERLHDPTDDMLRPAGTVTECRYGPRTAQDPVMNRRITAPSAINAPTTTALPIRRSSPARIDREIGTAASARRP